MNTHQMIYYTQVCQMHGLPIWNNQGRRIAKRKRIQLPGNPNAKKLRMSDDESDNDAPTDERAK